jgi:hypothetical protein
MITSIVASRASICDAPIGPLIMCDVVRREFAEDSHSSAAPPRSDFERRLGLGEVYDRLPEPTKLLGSGQQRSAPTPEVGLGADGRMFDPCSNHVG